MATTTNQRKYSLFIFIFAATGFMVSLLAGCTSDVKSAKTVAGLKDLRQELTDGEKQIDNVLAATNALPGAGDNLKSAVDELENQIDETQKEQRIIRDRYTDMRDRAAEYQTNWRNDAQAYDSPELRQAADARADRVARSITIASPTSPVKPAMPMARSSKISRSSTATWSTT